MPNYVYETITTKPGEKPRLFEFYQSILDEPFTEHQETGEPIRRVALGGFGALTGRNTDRNSGNGCCPGSGCCG